MQKCKEKPAISFAGRIYATDGDVLSFDANLLSAEPIGDGTFAVTLDRTAFFPGGGGQNPDDGWLTAGGVRVRVLSAKEENGTVVHITDAPLPSGAVRGEVNPETRLPRMQHHTGEHILSGVIHKLYGFDNVGFHLGEDVVTVDTSGEMTPEMLAEAERLANEIVFDDRPVIVSFPTTEELARIDYRSKMELSGEVRLVSIPDADTCACCAPHCRTTGAVGLIKIVDAMRYKGGMRLSILSGRDAVAAFSASIAREKELSKLLSAPPAEHAAAVARLLGEAEALRFSLRGLMRDAMLASAAAEPETDGDILLCRPDADTEAMRLFADEAAKKCRMAVALSGTEGAYRYVIASEKVDLRAAAREINAALGGRGGGRDTMISGTFASTLSQIKSYFRLRGEE